MLGKKAVCAGNVIYSDVTNDGYSTSLQMCAQTADENGIIALIDARPTNGICDNVCLLCNRLNITHLSLSWEIPETVTKDLYSFFYHPPPEVISKVYASHIKKMDWDRFSFLYEDDGSFIRLQEVINTWRNDINPILFKKLDPDGDNKETFKHIFKVARMSYHIIDCKTKNIKKYMEEIKQVENITSYQSIILTSLDAYSVDLSSIDIDANVVTWHLTRTNDDEWKDIGIPPRDDITIETALVVDALNHLDKSINAMLSEREKRHEEMAYKNVDDRTTNMFGKPPSVCYKSGEDDDYANNAWKTGVELRDAMLQTTISNGLTGDIQFDEYGKRTNFVLHYSKLNGENRFTYAGSWNSSTNKINDSNTGHTYKPETELRVITKRGKPYIMPSHNSSEPPRGYVIDLMEHIMDHIRNVQNYSLKYSVSLGPDDKYGNPIEGSRRWDGLIGELMEHKADLAICDLTITSDRNAVVDFSLPFMSLGISMLFRVEPPPEADMFSFINPLDTDVWLYLAVGYIFVSLVLLICARMSQDDWVNPHPCNRNPESLENIWSLYNCMWLCMGSIMTQGCDILPRGYGSRWIAGTWYFFALIVTASYTANMSTFISNDRRSNSIKNAKDLSEQTEVSYGALYNGSTYKFFENSNDTVYQKIWQVMSSANPTVFTNSNDEGKERVLRSKGRYVFFMESTTIEYYTKQDCNLTMVGSKLDSKDYGIAMPKNSRYRIPLNNAILALQESGKLNELKSLWWRKEDAPEESCPTDDKEEGDEVQMKNTSGIFLVLGLGGILGLITAIIGFLLHAHEICVKEKITFKEALVSEWKASLDPRVLNKPAAPPRSAAASTKSDSERRERSHSRAVSVLKAAQSFINFDEAY
ncbi:glutamate receptor ionotropic, kainate 2-like isoform X2 [Choristoneura fumiferana]